MGSTSGQELLVPVTEAGRAGLAALTSHPQQALVALDFDGTLAPIVPDPDAARAHPDAVPAMARLAPRVGTVAVVTGRPAAVAVRYGGFAGVSGLEHLVVLGHYGAEHWDAATGAVRAPEPHPGVAAVQGELPGALETAGAWRGTWVEDKGRAVAVHTRRAEDPAAAAETLRKPLEDLAAAHGLVVEPGRFVLELRPPGMDKGRALTSLVREREPGAVMYVGDDLGDLAAYDAVDALRDEGIPGVLVCAGSPGNEGATSLADRADVVVDGPDGVVALLSALAAAVD